MMLHHQRGRAPRKSILVLAGVLLAGALTIPARAAEKAPGTSLALIPADAAYYSAMLRNREQFDAVAKSKAWARIQQLPAFQTGWAMLKAQYDDENGKLAPLRAWLAQEETSALIDLLVEAWSDEMFFYAGSNCADFSNLYAQFYMATFLQGVEIGIRNPKLKADEIQKVAAKAGNRPGLLLLARNLDKIKAPDFVLGFKLASPKKAEDQIKRLEELLKAVVAQQPLLEGRLKRVKIGSGSFLTLSLDGAMVPWDPQPITDQEETAGEFAGVVKKLKEFKLTLSLGVRDNFLLLSLGSSTDVLAKLGGAGKRLTERPELKPLVRAADKRLTGISYTSKAFAGSTRMTDEDIDRMAKLIPPALEATGVPKDKRLPLEKDAIALVGEIKANRTEPAASLSFSYLSERGYEGYDYHYGPSPERDGSKPLTLLNHVGGDPILAVVGRSKGTLDRYRSLSKWIKTIYGHVESLAADQLDKEQREKYQQVRKAVLPFLKRLDAITGEMLLPALADGQAGFVLDSKWKSKQWHKDMPVSERALPMLELGILVGVSDAELLQKAVKSYRKLIEDALARARELAPPGEIPPVKMPDPEVKIVKNGKLYLFHLPTEEKVGPQAIPTAGLSAKVGVVAVSPDHAERLLTPKPLKIEGGPLADIKRPLAGAFYFNWPALVDAATPWILFGVESGIAKMPKEEPDPKANILKQVRTVLDVLKVFGISSSATYIEEGVLITHSETVIRDR